MRIHGCASHLEHDAYEFTKGGFDALTPSVAAERALAEGPPMGRIARAEEVAAVTAFLLSDEAPYLNGQSIAVDGAWTASFGEVCRPDLPR